MGGLQLMAMLGEYYDALENNEEVPYTLEDIMTWHLTSNHYPPADPAWIPICLEIVDKLRNHDAQWTDTIEVPRPYYIPESQWQPELFTYETVVEALHLDHFLVDYSEPITFVNITEQEREEDEEPRE